MEGQLTCNSCSNSIDNLDNYCSGCGEAQKFSEPRRDASQLGSFLSVVFLFSAALIWLLIDLGNKAIDNINIYDKTDWLRWILRPLLMSIPLLLSLAMKPSGKKTLAIIFASIYTLIELYWFIKSLIPVEPIYFDF